MRGVVGIELEVLRDALLGPKTAWHIDGTPAESVSEALVARGLLVRRVAPEESPFSWYDDITPIGRVVLAASERR